MLKIREPELLIAKPNVKDLYFQCLEGVGWYWLFLYKELKKRSAIGFGMLGNAELLSTTAVTNDSLALPDLLDGPAASKHLTCPSPSAPAADLPCRWAWASTSLPWPAVVAPLRIHL